MSSSRIEILRERVTQNPSNELFRFSLGKELFDAGRYDEAIKEFDVALQQKPDWMVVAILLGRCWREQKDLTKARHYLELAQKLAREQNHEGPLEETTALLAELGK
jgi:tetratricopeptide (TPR) repeat protein